MSAHFKQSENSGVTLSDAIVYMPNKETLFNIVVNYCLGHEKKSSSSFQLKDTG